MLLIFKLLMSMFWVDNVENQMEFNLVQKRKENSHHDHIPLNVKGNRNLFFSVYQQTYSHRYYSPKPQL